MNNIKRHRTASRPGINGIGEIYVDNKSITERCPFYAEKQPRSHTHRKTDRFPRGKEIWVAEVANMKFKSREEREFLYFCKLQVT